MKVGLNGFFSGNRSRRKEKFEFKPIVLQLKIDLLSHPAHGGEIKYNFHSPIRAVRNMLAASPAESKLHFRGSPENDTKLHLINSSSGYRGSFKYPFIASTLIQNSSTC